MAAPSRPFWTKRLLLAEDDRDLRELLAGLLEDAGASVVAVPNGRAALEQLERDGRFDAAILDVRMPLLSGLDVLRESAPVRAVPILLISSFADAELRQRATELGAVRVIEKPFDPAELRQALGAVLGASCADADG